MKAYGLEPQMTKRKISKRAQQLVSQTCQTLTTQKFKAPETLEFLAYLLHSIGSSIAQENKVSSSFSLEELQKRYYKGPSVDSALMLQGLLLFAWEEDLRKQPDKLFYKEEKKEGE